jgi:hypothetical protein
MVSEQSKYETESNEGDPSTLKGILPVKEGIREAGLKVAKPDGTNLTYQFTNLLTPSLQNILHDKCEIENIDAEVIIILVINLNAMSKTMLTKKESQDLMISTLHTL